MRENHAGLIKAEKKTPARWIEKWFGRRSLPEDSGTGERRESFRLPLNRFSPLDASLVTRSGAVVAALIHNLSAGGLSCQVFEPEPFSKGQPLLLLCVLPLSGRTFVQTDALTIHHRGRASARSQVLGLSFGEFIDPQSEDTLHRYIIEQQLELRGKAARRKREALEA
jgi:c-di-GMP-binding flagellar brake protein YcgR